MSPAARDRRSVCIAALATALLLVACGTPHPRPKSGLRWEREIMEAQQALNLGDTGRARRKVESSLISARRTARGRPEAARVLESVSHELLAELDAMEADYASAVEHLRTALTIRTMLFGDDWHALFPCASLGTYLVRNGQLHEGLEAHARLVGTHRGHPRNQRLAPYWKEMGLALSETGHADLALEYFETSLGMQRYVDGPGRALLAETLTDYARALETLGRTDEAEAARATAREMLAGSHYGYPLWGSTAFDMIRRWILADAPLTVAVAPPPEESPYDAATLDAVVDDAIAAWKARSQPGWREIRRAEGTDGAAISIDWPRAERRRSIRLGWTQIERNADETAIEHMRVRVPLMRGPDPVDLGLLRSVVTHELGHALGIVWHSPYPGDLMYCCTQGSWNDGRITERDTATLVDVHETGAEHAKDLDRSRLYQAHRGGGFSPVAEHHLEQGPGEGEVWVTYDEMRGEDPGTSARYARTPGGWEKVVGSRLARGPARGEVWYSYEEMMRERKAETEPHAAGSAR